MGQQRGPRWHDVDYERHPGAAARRRGIRGWLPPLNFITLHYTYFIGTTLLTSVIFWAISAPQHSISYADSIFLAVSAMTEAGLTTVDPSQMTLGQQLILLMLTILGSTIWVSIWTVLARKYVFEQRFHAIVRESQSRSRTIGPP